MAETEFLNYKNKPLVRNGDQIYYGNMSDPYVIKLNILSERPEGNTKVPEKVSVKLLKNDTQLQDKENAVKQSVRDSLYDALDFGVVWLEKALKEQ